MLYMIARYSHKARTAGEKEKWIRKTPLLVLLYEGIKADHSNLSADLNGWP